MIGGGRPHNIVRIIAFFWIALLLVCPRLQAAPQLICYNVQPGDTSASLAFRLTNDSASQREAWFKIFDPATARWVPKASYARLETGWRACVEEARFSQPRYLAQRGSNTPLASAPGAGQRLAAMIRAMGWWWFPFVMSITALMWTFVDAHDERRRKTTRDLKNFGKTFVDEFERPLAEPSSNESPVRSRLNVIPHRRTVEIFLAPGDGRRYPNLSDHRKNVEYDVDRVISALADRRFVLGSLASQGPWVVIPFRLDTPSKKAGWS